MAGWLWAASLGIFIAYIARLTDVTHDAFHEMALAKEWFASGAFPTTDVFAFTDTRSPVVHHEWGTGLLLYGLVENTWWGLDGLAILRLILVVAVSVLSYRLARNQGGHPYLIALAVPVVLPLLWVGFANLRAQLLTLVFLIAQMLLLQYDIRGRRTWIWGWLILYVVWLNVHAGFVVGVAHLALHMLERWVAKLLISTSGRCEISRVLTLRAWTETIQKYWHHLLLLPCIVVGLSVNPWGLDYVRYLAHALTMERPTMLEWKPLWYTYQPGIALLSFASAVFLLAYVAKNRRWTRLSGWLFCALAAYMAMKHLRHGSLFGVVWMASMPGWLTPTPLGRRWIAFLQTQRRPVMRIAKLALVMCGGFVLAYAPWKSTVPSKDPNTVMVYPVDACSFLMEKGWRGNIVTPFASGGYVSWRCHPNLRVSIDGRYEVAFEDHVLPLHDRFYNAHAGWEQLLHLYPVDLILIQRTAPVLQVLSTSEEATNWDVLYEDRAFVVFAKKSSLVQHRDRSSVADPVSIH